MFGDPNFFKSTFTNDQQSGNKDISHEQNQLKNKREEVSISIRKSARDNEVKKRRQLNTIDTLPYKQSNLPMTPFELQIASFRKRIFNTAELKQLHQCMKSEDLQRMYYGVIGVRRILSSVQNNPPIQQVLDARLLPQLIKFATQDQQQQLKIEAVWALSTLVSGDGIQTQTIVNKAGLQIFIGFLQHKNNSIVEHALWSIGNFAADRAIYRDMLIKYGIVELLTHLINTSSHSQIVVQSSWALSNIIRVSPLPPSEITQPVLVILSKVIMNQKVTDVSILKDILWGISYVIENDQQKLEVFFQTGISQKLLELSNCGIDVITVPVLRNLGHLCYGRQQFVQWLIKNGLLIKFNQLIDKQKNNIKKQICWASSNIAASCPEHAEFLFNNNILIEKFYTLLVNEQRADIRIDCGYVFINLVKFGDADFFINFFLEHKLIDVYLDIIQNNENTSLIEMGLKGINACLRLGQITKGNYGGQSIMMRQFVRKNGLNILENAQDHDNQSIYQLAHKILEGYFDIVDPLKP